MNPAADAENQPNDPESQSVLPADWRVRLHRYACRYLDTAAAEDVVQESSIRLDREDKAVHNPLAWLHRTVRNLALNEIRRNRRTIPFDHSPLAGAPDPTPGPANHLEHLEKIERLDSLCRSLGDRERELLRLKFEENASYREIGEQMNLTATNVGYILCKTLQGLQVALRSEGGQR